MKPSSIVLTCLASFAMLAFVSPAALASQGTGAGLAKQVQRSATSAVAGKSAQRERTQMNRAFTSKWSTYVQRVYGVPADVWSERMAPSIAAADPSNLSNAMKRDTFEGAMAELGGVGYKLSDDQAITMLAAQKGGTVTPQVLGALTNDLVYTPVAPCRILDTRNAGGPILAGQTRSFDAVASSFTSQGGSATNCNTQLTFTALAVNLTAVTPANPGFATAYPFGTTRPNAASINYTAGAIVNNGLIVQINNPLTSDDFTLWTLSTADFVADVVGYFAPPVATAVQCLTTSVTSVALLANATGFATAPACAAGYTQTGLYCRMDFFVDTIVGLEGSNCFGRAGAGATSINVSSRCCRVPGR